VISTFFYQIQLDTDVSPNSKVLEKYRHYSHLFKNDKVASVASLKNRFEKDKFILKKVLASYGYFDSTVQYIISKDKKDLFILNMFLKLNQRFKIKKIYFSGLSEDEEDKIKKLLHSKEDTFFFEDDLSKSLETIEDYFKDRGYPFVIYFRPKIELNFAEKNLNLYIHIDKGEKKYFGSVDVKNLKYLKEDFVRANFLWKKGDLYQQYLVEQTKKKLINSGLVSYVGIKNEFSEDEALSALSTQIKVYEAPRKIFVSEVGWHKEVGDNTYGELLGRVSWKHKNLFGHGESVHLSGDLAYNVKKELPNFKSLQVKTKKPHSFNIPSLSLIAELSYMDEDTSAYKGIRYILSGGFIKEITEHLTCDAQVLFEIAAVKKEVSKEYKDDKFETDSYNFNATIVSFPMNLSLDKTNDLLDPTKGFKFNLTFEPNFFLRGKQENGKPVDKTFVSTQVSFVYLALLYKQRDKRIVFHNQFSFGNIFGAVRDEIMPHKRLYLGGVKTLRAYGEKSVGDIDNRGKPHGGISFGMWTPEFRFKFQEWGVNLHHGLGFVSSANLFDTTNKNFFNGSGISFVYYSKIVPIQIGVAVPWERQSFIFAKFIFYAHITNQSRIYQFFLCLFDQILLIKIAFFP